MLLAPLLLGLPGLVAAGGGPSGACERASCSAEAIPASYLDTEPRPPFSHDGVIIYMRGAVRDWWYRSGLARGS